MGGVGGGEQRGKGGRGDFYDDLLESEGEN